MRIFYLLTAILMLTSCNSSINKTSTPIRATDGVIHLCEPNVNQKGHLMTALQNRCSVREYDTKSIDLETLSDLLWAANGINRVENGKRTAPSALNAQDILIYVCMPEGAYIYMPHINQLKQICPFDLRKEIADTQEFAKEAPLSLVLVSDLTCFPFEDKERATKLGCIDAGYVSQNIYLYCSINNLATVARGTMNTETLIEALMLNENQIPLLNHPIGYLKQDKQ